MKNIAYVLVLMLFAVMLIAAAVSRSSYIDPDTGRTEPLGSYRAVVTYTIDQRYGGWGISPRSRPNLRGVAYADDLGPMRGAGLQMCSTDYHHSVCVWDVRIPFSRHTRNFRFLVQEQVGGFLPEVHFGRESVTDVSVEVRDAVVNLTVEMDNMFRLHLLNDRSPYVRGGRVRYEPDRDSLHLP